MKEKDAVWKFLFVILVLFMLAAVRGVIQYREYIPYVDESANVSAVNNLLNEGVPRVGVSKNSVMYDRPPVGHYYWTYLPELLLRVPLQIVGNILGFDNIQALTNLFYIAFILLLIYYVLKKYKDKKEYILTVALMIMGILCSKGLMNLAHYVRYYSMAMMTFVFCLIVIPLLLMSEKKRDLIKVFIIGIVPSFFHLLYLPFYFVIALCAVWNMKERALLNKRNVGLLSAILLIIGVCGGGYVLFVGKNNFFSMISIDLNSIKLYIKYVISFNIIELILAVVSVLIITVYYDKILPEQKKLLQIAAFTLVMYAIILGKKYNIARYYYPSRICYIVIVVTAIFIFMDNWKFFNSKLRYGMCVIMILVWSIFSKGDLNDYPGLPLVSWNEYYDMENKLQEFDYDNVIMFTDCQMPVSIKHPDWYVYSLRNYESNVSKGTIEYNGSVYCYRTKDGFYSTNFNQVYAGKKMDIDRILANMEDKNAVMIFWRSNYGASEEKVRQFFENTELENNVIKAEDFRRIWNSYFEEHDFS